jgi:UDP-GlcNAc:undecaprenyl-phosphate GlcNAc-1-phosphate transferase
MLVLFVAGLVLAWAAIVLLRPFAPALGLMDRPGGRKIHETPTPVIGGLGIAAGLGFGLAVAGGVAGAPLPLLAAMLAIVALGAADDRFDLPKALRFLVHLAAGCAVAAAAGVDGLPLVRGLTGIEVPAPVAILLGGIAICALINAVNWLDGVDGMLGLLALITLTTAFYFLREKADPFLLSLIAATAGAVVAFLGFNLRRPGRRRAAVFMGDAGSGLLAVVLGYVMLALAQMEGRDPLLMVAAGNALFFADMAFVMGLRLVTHGRIWRCDRTHLHHRLAERGLSVSEIVLVAACAHSLFLAIQFRATEPALGLMLPATLALLAGTVAAIAVRSYPQIQRLLPTFERLHETEGEGAGR